MKKGVIIGIICLLFMLVTPLISGALASQQSDGKPTDLGWTSIRGIITKPQLKNGGNEVSFRAIYVHYSCHEFGRPQSGVLYGFQQITLNNNYLGIMRNHYVFARFNGVISIE